MVALTAIPITCWLCAWLARPGKPLVGNEVQELVYGRLLGRQHRVMLAALIVTGMTLLVLVVTLPQRIDGDLQSVRGEQAKCAAQLGRDETDSGRDMTAAATVRCLELEAGGVWVEEVFQRGSGGQITAPVATPSEPGKAILGSEP